MALNGKNYRVEPRHPGRPHQELVISGHQGKDLARSGGTCERLSEVELQSAIRKGWIKPVAHRDKADD